MRAGAPMSAGGNTKRRWRRTGKQWLFMRDTRGAEAAVAENNREAIELLELVGRA